jgi:signal transduction histidine kinase
MLDTKKTLLLLQLTAQINSTTSTEDLLREVMEAAKIILNGEASSLILHNSQTKELIIQYPTGSASAKISGMRIPDTEGVAGWVWLNQKPVIINDASKDKRFRGDLIKKDFQTQNLICVPLKVREGKNIGVLQVINKVNAGVFDSNDQQLLEALAHQAAIALERQQLQENMLEKERQLTIERKEREKEAAISFSKGVEEERARIARELHDHILGIISTTMRKMQHERLAISSENTKAYLGKTLEDLDELSSDIRAIMEDLKPMSLQHFGLAHAIEIVALKQTESIEKPPRLKTNLKMDNWKGSDFELITIYRIIQEALQNAVKHGKPKHITISTELDSLNCLEICIEDDGIGFDMNQVKAEQSKHFLKSGNGLLNMEYRASTINATITWESEISKGTRFLLKLKNED